MYYPQGQYWAGRIPSPYNSPPNMAVANFVDRNLPPSLEGGLSVATWDDTAWIGGTASGEYLIHICGTTTDLYTGGKVTSAGGQVTLCDLIWHVISRSGVVISITNCYIRFTLLTLLYHHHHHHHYYYYYYCYCCCSCCCKIELLIMFKYLLVHFNCIQCMSRLCLTDYLYFPWLHLPVSPKQSLGLYTVNQF